MRTVLITGATSGIGKATAERLAEENYRLILCGRKADKLEELRVKLTEKVEVITLCFDVQNQAQVANAISTLPADWQTVDILINNAGNAHGLDPLSDCKTPDWDAMIDSNVKGLLYVSSEIIPQMKQRGNGHIINISSVAALQSYVNGVVYSATKKAVDGISEGMRLELTEFGVKVTNIRPGLVETNFSLVRFKGDAARAASVYQGYQALKPEDIADIIAYAVSAPEHVTIADVTVYPKAQSSPTTVYRLES